MAHARCEFVTWTVALLGVIVAVALASLPLSVAATGLLAALWCRKIDREEYAVQLVSPELLESNR